MFWGSREEVPRLGVLPPNSVMKLLWHVTESLWSTLCEILTTEFTVDGLFFPHSLIASLEASDGSLCWQLPVKLSVQPGPDTCYLNHHELKHLFVDMFVYVDFPKAAYWGQSNSTVSKVSVLYTDDPGSISGSPYGLGASQSDPRIKSSEHSWVWPPNKQNQNQKAVYYMNWMGRWWVKEELPMGTLPLGDFSHYQSPLIY